MEMKCCTGKQFIEFCAILNFNLLNFEDLTLDALKNIKDDNVNVHHEINLSTVAENMSQNITKALINNNNVCTSLSKMAIMRKKSIFSWRIFSQIHV